MSHSNVMGGSTAERRIQCHGSRQAEKDAPEAPESDYARIGTLLHKGVEKAVRRDLTLKQAEKVFADFCAGENLLKPSHVEAKLLPAYKAWLDIADEYEIEIVAPEVRLMLPLQGRRDAFGTADIIATDKSGTLHVVDWKFGDGVLVAAEENTALTFYATAATADPRFAPYAAPMGYSGAVLHIIQPTERADEVVSSWRADAAWIDGFLRLAEAAVVAGDAPQAERHAGSWCRWCKAKLSCVEYRKNANQLAKVDVAGVSPLNLAMWLDMAELLSPQIEQLRERAVTLLRDGLLIPGWKVVQKRATRRWKNEEELALQMEKYPDMFSPGKLLSPTQAEKTCPEIFNTLQDKVIAKSTGLTLVRGSDKRAAVSSTRNIEGDARPALLALQKKFAQGEKSGVV